MLFVTYKKFGILQRAIITRQRYKDLKNDATIEELQLHPNQFDMEKFYKESKGLPVKNKQLLFD
jgi:hypothetical protein